MIFSWGMDGTTGQARYNQADSEGIVIDDHSLFTVSMTPLQLKSDEGIILWQNDAPQSVRSVRPLMLEFAKEETEYVLQVHNDVNSQIANLEKFTFTKNGKTLEVTCSFYETMIDGKILNMITGTKSTQSCPLCHCKPSQFNDPNRKKFEVNDSVLVYGCQPLHAAINIVNCLLHISYRIDFSAWQARTPQQKQSLKTRKNEVQQILLEIFKMRVDMPKEGGTGSTTTGAVCRKLLSKPYEFADALKIDRTLVKNLAEIITMINSIDAVDIDIFEKLCADTYYLYIDKYKWYPMPATLHKILVHSTKIISTLPLPAGFMSEQGGEACNKYYRSDRLHHGRKCSREANMEDVFYRAMDSSDPVVVSKRTRITKKMDINFCSKNGVEEVNVSEQIDCMEED